MNNIDVKEKLPHPQVNFHLCIKVWICGLEIGEIFTWRIQNLTFIQDKIIWWNFTCIEVCPRVSAYVQVKIHQKNLTV